MSVTLIVVCAVLVCLFTLGAITNSKRLVQKFQTRDFPATLIVPIFKSIVFMWWDETHVPPLPTVEILQKKFAEQGITMVPIMGVAFPQMISEAEKRAPVQLDPMKSIQPIK